MGVDICGIGDVVAGTLQPSDVVHLPVEEVPGPVVACVRPIKGDLDRPGRSQPEVGRRTAALVQALAGDRLALSLDGVVGKVVVRLIGGHALLVQQVGSPSIVTHREYDVALVLLIVGQLGEVNTAGPILRNGQVVARRPLAGDQAGDPIHRALRLHRAWLRRDVHHEPSAEALVVPDSVDIDPVALHGIDGHEERQAFAHIGTRRRRVAADLQRNIVGRLAGDLPVGGSQSRILDGDRVRRGFAMSAVAAGQQPQRKDAREANNHGAGGPAHSTTHMHSHPSPRHSVGAGGNRGRQRSRSQRPTRSTLTGPDRIEDPQSDEPAYFR